jgi:hypothetical protein
MRQKKEKENAEEKENENVEEKVKEKDEEKERDIEKGMAGAAAACESAPPFKWRGRLGGTFKLQYSIRSPSGLWQTL